jgi:two-component system, sensor histidine kinase and response regulator
MEHPRVLIVDDDRALLDALPQAFALRMSYVQVDTAASAQEALQQMQEQEYDAVISDIKMPGMDGIALIEHLQQCSPEIPTLLITGHGERDLVVRALRAGAYDFLEKPIERDYLISSLQRALQARQMRRQIKEQQEALEQYTHQLEHMVEERTHALVEANEAKDLVLGVVSHELKTPLTALKGLLQLIHRRAERVASAADQQSDEVNAFFETLPGQLSRAIHQIDVQTHLINELLDLSRITAGTLNLSPGPCNLVTLVRETVEDLRLLAPDRSLLLTLPEQESVVVLADAERLSQVLTNYGTNALRYTPADQPIQIGLTLEEKSARVWVRDHGPGLSENAQKEVWQRFHQVEGIAIQQGAEKGVGLGLAICQNLVAAHQGSVGVESTLGDGATFWFTIPLLTQTGADPQA